MVRPVMRRLTSTQSRLSSILLAAAIVTAPLHVVHAGPPTVEQLYTQGQEKFDSGAYGDAGDLWAQAVRQLPEDKKNSATRQTIMNLALDAYLRAYRNDDEERSHIDKAKTLLDEYEASLQGTNVKLSAEIASEKGKIEGILEEIAAKEAAAANEPEPEPEREPEPDYDPMPVGNDRPGTGLVIGGAVMLGVGAGGIGLLLGGVIGGLRAQTEFNTAEPDTPEREDARKRGRTMNVLAITGGVVAPIFIGAGAALLVIGLRKNKQARSSMMVLPEAGPSFVGLSLSGRW
jgi:hypothetical protein